jgi:hypothetical protein
MNIKIPNSEVIRSLWRRVKKDIEVIRSPWRPIVKKDTKVRDLKPVKDVKGGGGLTGESKPITGGTGTADTTSTWCYVPQKNEILSDAQRTSSFRVGTKALSSRLSRGVYTIWCNHFTTL